MMSTRKIFALLLVVVMLFSFMSVSVSASSAESQSLSSSSAIDISTRPLPEAGKPVALPAEGGAHSKGLPLLCQLGFCSHKPYFITHSTNTWEGYYRTSLGWSVLPGQTYSVTTTKARNTNFSASITFSDEFISGEVGISIDYSYSVSVTIGGTNTTNASCRLYQDDNYWIVDKIGGFVHYTSWGDQHTPFGNNCTLRGEDFITSYIRCL